MTINEHTQYEMKWSDGLELHKNFAVSFILHLRIVSYHSNMQFYKLLNLKKMNLYDNCKVVPFELWIVQHISYYPINII